MKKWSWFLVSFIVLLLDQLTKWWALSTLVPYQSVPVFPMFSFTLAYNTGAAFSFLSSAGNWHQWFFAGFSILMSIFLAIWLMRLSPKEKLQALGVSLILGGALGNLYDRSVLGHVIDFILLYYKNYHWPVFNLADTAICIGAFLLLLDVFMSWRKESLGAK